MGNTVGSLSDVQQQVILGCVLGDGYMRKKTHAHLQITHSIKQKKYVDWKYQILKNLVISPPSAYRGNAGRVGYRFFTRSLSEITLIHDKFYCNGVKTVPKNINISPLTLAVWYMDDGSKNNRASYFNTQMFDQTSQINLLNALSKLGIEANLNRDKKYYRIRTLVSSTPRLVNLINPYVISSMRYKIPI